MAVPCAEIYLLSLLYSFYKQFLFGGNERTGQIPIAMCGKMPHLAASFSTLMRGEKISSPQSSVGSNISQDRTSPEIPKAIFVGAGFTEEELQEMRLTPEGSNIPWLAPHPNRKDEAQKREQDGSPMSMMEMIVSRVKRCLREQVGLVEGKEANVKPGLYRF